MVDRDASARSARTYWGGCDCGAVRYEVELDLQQPAAGTCSVWEQPLAAGAFRVTAGSECLQGVCFAGEAASHFYCVHCGVRSFSRLADRACAERYSIDIKCLHGRGPAPLAREAGLALEGAAAALAPMQQAWGTLR